MRHVLSRIRAAVGAAMIIGVASPGAAHAQRPAVRVRAEAQWVGRRGSARQWLAWRLARRPVARASWRRGYARGFVVGRYPVRAATWRRAWYGRRAASARLQGRFWGRRRLGRMGGRWSL